MGGGGLARQERRRRERERGGKGTRLEAADIPGRVIMEEKNRYNSTTFSERVRKKERENGEGRRGARAAKQDGRGLASGDGGG